MERQFRLWLFCNATSWPTHNGRQFFNKKTDYKNYSRTKTSVLSFRLGKKSISWEHPSFIYFQSKTVDKKSNIYFIGIQNEVYPDILSWDKMYGLSKYKEDISAKIYFAFIYVLSMYAYLSLYLQSPMQQKIVALIV